MQGNPFTKEFLIIRSRLQGQELLHAIIDWQTAPISYSHKPSVLINLGSLQSSQLAKLWSKFGKDYLNAESSCLNGEHHCNYYNFDIDIICDEIIYNDIIFKPFFGINNSLHLFCYTFHRLEMICQNEDIRSFLREAGYSFLEPEYCIANLKKRFRLSCPHEIGIFLGYPLDDVKAFIENRGKNYLFNGYWKVYSDVPGAVKRFQSYNEAKIRMLRKWMVKQG